MGKIIIILYPHIQQYVPLYASTNVLPYCYFGQQLRSDLHTRLLASAHTVPDSLCISAAATLSVTVFTR